MWGTRKKTEPYQGRETISSMVRKESIAIVFISRMSMHRYG